MQHEGQLDKQVTPTGFELGVVGGPAIDRPPLRGLGCRSGELRNPSRVQSALSALPLSKTRARQSTALGLTKLLKRIGFCAFEKVLGALTKGCCESDGP